MFHQQTTHSLALHLQAISGCLTLLEIFWKFAKSPGNILAEFVCLLFIS